MTKRIALFLFLATVMAVFTVSAGAQAITNVKGIVKDENGKPMVGATIELLNLENGRKATVKTTKIGEYYSMGMPGGNYKISLIAPDGTVIFFLNNVPLRLAIENVYDIDLAKQTALAAKDSGVTEEQRKAVEKAKKNNETIKSLNALLAQAIAQKNDKKYDEAVATMEQAATADQTHDVVFASLADAIRQYFKDSGLEANRALIAAAGRISEGETVQITNNPWAISAPKLQAELGMESVHLVNDFAAQSMAVMLLQPKDLVPVGGLPLPKPGTQDEQTFVIVGPGTGLGVGGLLIRQGKCSVLQTEGGHAGFAAHSPEDIEILKRLNQRYGRVSNERLI